MTGRRGAGKVGREAPTKGASVLAIVSSGNVYCVSGTLLSACFTFAKKTKTHTKTTPKKQQKKVSVCSLPSLLLWGCWWYDTPLVMLSLVTFFWTQSAVTWQDGESRHWTVMTLGLLSVV